MIIERLLFLAMVLPVSSCVTCDSRSGTTPRDVGTSDATADGLHDVPLNKSTDADVDVTDLSGDMLADQSDAVDDDASRSGLCDCGTESAECRWYENRYLCAMEGDCASEGDCPPVFACEGGSCLCLTPSECGPYCEVDTDCPPHSLCDPRLGACLKAPTCISDAECLRGYWCIEGSCQAPGALGEGEDCNGDRDCVSAICSKQDGTCNSRCNSDDDCEAGTECEPDGYRYACRSPLPQRVCAASCPVDSICDGSVCRPPVCVRGDDCAVSDCFVAVPLANVGSCEDGPKECKSHEFRSVDPDGPVLCRIAVACEDDADCSAPYRCELAGFETYAYCSREPDQQ